ncbi:MAG: signal recognition particle-docking protein FtsY [Synechococcus sp. ELA057]
MVYDWFQRSASSPAPEAQETVAEKAVADLAAGSPSSDQQPLSGSDQATSGGSTPVPAASAPAIGSVDEAALDWARQAYARLKAQQEAAKAATAPVAPAAPAPEETTDSGVAPLPQPQPEAAQEPETEGGDQDASQPPLAPISALTDTPAAISAPAEASPSRGMSLLEQAALQRQQRLQEITAAALEEPAAVVAPQPQESVAGSDSEPQLGVFDETFTWSAEVLAAQGRRIEEISLEEIDWLGRLRLGLEKTRRGFVSQLLENLGDDPLTPEVLDDLETTLLRADVGVQATDQVLEALRRRLNEEVVDPAEGLRFLKQQLRDLLQRPIDASGVPLLAPQRDRLNIWLMVGVNGVGKTTTLGKLANLAVRSGYSALIAAADTFRAAAVQQVSIWGERSGVPVVANPTANADPAAVVFDAIGAARSRDTELVLVDTAGRLQTKHNLMEELSKVRRIIDRLAPEAVVESLLVLDASQGQNGLRQAMAFASAANLTGVVITKLDGSARGGVALAVASEAGLPIRFIGAGEGIRDLRPFNSFEFVEALLAG